MSGSLFLSIAPNPLGKDQRIQIQRMCKRRGCGLSKSSHICQRRISFRKRRPERPLRPPPAPYSTPV